MSNQVSDSKTKYIFVTGGVVSGLGKGITAASIGLLLKSSGLSVDAVKFDPYLNVDPGTMSPHEHGEVYVLDDTSECDLDLGHYERFLDTNLNKTSSVTSGKIYNSIIEKERNGDFLGKDVRLIPNVTDNIKERFKESTDQVDIRMIEIGGGISDMEAVIFLESFRQFRLENKENVFHVHLGYIPFLACSKEYKSKPMQNSIRELLMKGLKPDLIVSRCEEENDRKLPQIILDKVALYSNLSVNQVISLPDQKTIYQVPKVLMNDSKVTNALSEFTGKKLNIQLPAFFDKVLQIDNRPTKKIALVAKYNHLEDSYTSVLESLKIAGVENGVKVKVDIISSDQEDVVEKIKNYDAICVPGGFGNRGMEGKIKVIQYARQNKIPLMGICLGLQMMVVEFARNVCGIENAVSLEMFDNVDELKNKEVLIDYIPGQENIHKKGGTMRLGGYNCHIQPSTLAREIFGTDIIRERHRHRLEVQNQYVETLENNGLVISGKFMYNNNKDYLVEIVELPKEKHPYFISIQSHPEFLSRLNKSHPLFHNLIKTTLTL